MKSSITRLSLNLITWALMPIILFSLATIIVPYLIDKSDIQTTSNKDRDWISILLNNDIKMHKADSVVLPLGYDVLLHQGSVKHLFPDYKCKDISLSHCSGDKSIFLMLYTNCNIPIIVDSLYYKNGEWIGFNMHNGREIRLGKMINSPNLSETVMDIPSTYINVYSILTLGIILACLSFLLRKWHISNVSGKFLLWMLICFSSFCIGLLIDNYKGFRISPAYLPEIVFVLFIISEIAIEFSVLNSIHQREYFYEKKKD